MTLGKIAKLANVSISTVSKAFSGSSEISAETKNLIYNVAKENGCFEKYYKPKYDKKLIAVICPELLGIHYSQMVTYMEKEIEESGGTMLVSVSNFSAATQSRLIEYYSKYAGVDGIIIIEPVGNVKNNSDVPIIQICYENNSKSTHCVKMDISPGLNDAMSTLKELGHTKIGFIGEKYTETEFGYFKNFMEKNNMPIDYDFIDVNDYRFYDCGYYGIDNLIKKQKLPTAVFSAYSHVTIGVLQRLNEEQLKIPEDISVICMDDIKVEPHKESNLSCIQMHMSDLCSEAIHLMFRIFQSYCSSTKHVITVERQFFKGNSIAKAK